MGTLSSCGGGSSSARSSSVSGSRLHNTTEAYRQNRGTTAKDIRDVGRHTMTKEKGAQVDSARAKVLGEKAALYSGNGNACASVGTVKTGAAASARPPMPKGK